MVATMHSYMDSIAQEHYRIKKRLTDEAFAGHKKRVGQLLRANDTVTSGPWQPGRTRTIKNILKKPNETSVVSRRSTAWNEFVKAKLIGRGDRDALKLEVVPSSLAFDGYLWQSHQPKYRGTLGCGEIEWAPNPVKPGTAMVKDTRAEPPTLGR